MEYATAIPATNVRLDGRLRDISPRNLRDFILEIATIEGTSNPLDWIVEVCRLSPDQFPEGFTSIDELTYNDTFDFFDEEPVDTGFVRAELDSANMDLVEVVAGIVMEQLYALTSSLYAEIYGDDPAPPKPN